MGCRQICSLASGFIFMEAATDRNQKSEPVHKLVNNVATAGQLEGAGSAVSVPHFPALSKTVT